MTKNIYLVYEDKAKRFIYCNRTVGLASLIEALQAFWAFEPALRREARAFIAPKLGIPQIHFYVLGAILAEMEEG